MIAAAAVAPKDALRLRHRNPADCLPLDLPSHSCQNHTHCGVSSDGTPELDAVVPSVLARSPMPVPVMTGLQMNPVGSRTCDWQRTFYDVKAIFSKVDKEISSSSSSGVQAGRQAAPQRPLCSRRRRHLWSAAPHANL